VAEFFGLVVKPPLLKKQERWMTLVTEGICRLAENISSFDPRVLVESENFAAAVLSATHAAMKTSDETKLKALRNAVLNTALAPDREANVRETLLYLIDRLTSAHLSVLGAFSTYEATRKELKNAHAVPAMPLAADFPALSEDIDFANSLAFDLIDLNLLSMPRSIRYTGSAGALWMNQFGHLGTNQLTITELGIKLLRHISEPLTCPLTGSVAA